MKEWNVWRLDAYQNMVEQFAGEGKVYSVVSDSYDRWNALKNIWGEQLKDVIIEKGFSVENVNFGMGGGLLQQVNRDTMSWAMKASAICINGQLQEIYKDPITSQSKRSKKGGSR